MRSPVEEDEDEYEDEDDNTDDEVRAGVVGIQRALRPIPGFARTAVADGLLPNWVLEHLLVAKGHPAVGQRWWIGSLYEKIRKFNIKLSFFVFFVRIARRTSK